VVSVIEGVKHELHTGGDTEFLKYPEEILFDGVLAEGQFLGDLAHYQSITALYERLIALKAESAKPTNSVRPVNTPLRIAFIGGRGVIGKYSGIEGYYEEVGRRLADAGHEVTVYCRKPLHSGDENA